MLNRAERLRKANIEELMTEVRRGENDKREHGDFEVLQMSFEANYALRKLGLENVSDPNEFEMKQSEKKNPQVEKERAVIQVLESLPAATIKFNPVFHIRASENIEKAVAHQQSLKIGEIPDFRRKLMDLRRDLNFRNLSEATYSAIEDAEKLLTQKIGDLLKDSKDIQSVVERLRHSHQLNLHQYKLMCAGKKVFQGLAEAISLTCQQPFTEGPVSQMTVPMTAQPMSGPAANTILANAATFNPVPIAGLKSRTVSPTMVISSTANPVKATPNAPAVGDTGIRAPTSAPAQQHPRGRDGIAASFSGPKRKEAPSKIGPECSSQSTKRVKARGEIATDLEMPQGASRTSKGSLPMKFFKNGKGKWRVRRLSPR